MLSRACAIDWLRKAVYLQLVAGQRVQQQVHTLAASLILDHLLEAQGARVANVVLLQTWESLQQELPLLCCSHSHEHLRQRQA